jgi:hypothetical protein
MNTMIADETTKKIIVHPKIIQILVRIGIHLVCQTPCFAGDKGLLVDLSCLKFMF